MNTIHISSLIRVDYPLNDRITPVINDIFRLLEDSSYRIAVEHISEIHRDKPITPLKQAIYWIEYTMRTNGAHHLRPASHKLSWYQYYLLDTIALLAFTIIASYHLQRLIRNRIRKS